MLKNWGEPITQVEVQLHRARCQERLAELGLIVLPKQQLEGNLRASHGYLKDSYKNGRAQFFSMVADEPQTVVW